MKTLLLFVLLLPTFLVAQISDDFEDGDFTANPAWTGTTEKFIVNGSKQLQLNDTAASSAYLVTGNSQLTNTEWRCWVKCSFSPSSNNNARIYLVSDQADLGAPHNGYFLQLGESGSDDAIELFRQEGESVTSVCRGTDGLIATSFAIRIKVIRDTEGLWKVYADPAGGENFQPQGEGIDNTFTNTSFFGFYCMYTVSYNSKIYFDDVYVGPEIIDSDPPVVNLVSTISDSTLLVVFSETVDKMSGENTSNYEVNKGVGKPVTALQNELNGAEVMLSFDNKFENGQEYVLSVSGVKDLSGNLMTGQQITFSFYTAQPNDVVINEIMADPSPVVGLPDYEYLELFNRTNTTISLNHWTLTIGSTEREIGGVQIGPGGFLILADEEAGAELSAYGPFYGFSSFSLTNTGQTVTLYNKENNLISRVSYQDDWYKDPDKEDGGWSLEQINPENICSQGDNWRASNDAKGGTPGTINSVYSDLVLKPAVHRLELVADNLLRLYFNQAMDSTSLSDVSNYVADHEIGNPSQTFGLPDQPEAIELYFNETFLAGVIYQLTVKKSVLNCLGNQPGNDTILTFGIGEKPADQDMVINEILFNPWTDGVDYVEVYNSSDKVIDLNQLKLGTVKISPPNPPDTAYYTVINEQKLVVPGTYLLLTVSPETVKSQYHTSNPNGFVKVDPFPAYNNDRGTCLLINQEGEIIDAFDYSADMHYPLLNYTDGISLERINFDAPTNDKKNWHSASEASGFGTPAYKNSQFVSEDNTNAEIVVDPEIFSPDQDGYNDVVSIRYSFDQAGYSMTVDVFNSGGNLVRKLVNSEYLGTEGSIYWDGIMDDHTKASVGIYVFFIRVFDLEGKVKKYKKTCVLAAKL